MVSTNWRSRDFGSDVPTEDVDRRKVLRGSSLVRKRKASLGVLLLLGSSLKIAGSSFTWNRNGGLDDELLDSPLVGKRNDGVELLGSP